MKLLRIRKTQFVILTIIFVGICNIKAQEKVVQFDVGADLVSNYIWRGSKFGTGPAIQPSVSLSAGAFTLGTWGSFGVTDNEAPEADLYFSYDFDFGLSLGMTDYYYPGTPYTDFSSTDSTGSHGFEVNAGYSIGGFSLGANYMLNQAGLAGTAGSDMYFELGYGGDVASVFIGAGNGWHTPGAAAGDFAICNIGVSVTKEIPITDSYSLPVSGSAIFNPDQDQYYLVFGVSF